MTVWIRIALYIFAGWLYGSGLISDEVRAIITTDPEVAAGVELALTGLITAVPILWWQAARRLGWST